MVSGRVPMNNEALNWVLNGRVPELLPEQDTEMGHQLEEEEDSL